MPLITSELLQIDSIFPGIQWSLHQDTSTEPDQSLLDSIVHLGLLRPPIVKRHHNGYELICGARRLKALKKIGHPCRIACSLIQSNVEREDLLLLVAEDQVQTGPLSPIEAARFIALCNKWCEEPDHRMLDRITSTTSTTQRNRLLSLLQLEKSILASIHHGNISDKTGFLMTKMVGADRLLVNDLFTKLSLNKNKQLRFLELIQIITAAEGCTIEQFIAEHFGELRNRAIDNAPQQSNLLMKRLYELSHPRSHLARETFVRQVAEKNLPANCRVLPSSSFETDKVTLEVEFKDFSAFAKAWNKIKESL